MSQGFLATAARAAALLLTLAALSPGARAQTGGSHTLFGDLKVEREEAAGDRLLTLDIILYNQDGTIAGRQTVSNNGRYRFNNLRNGFYEIAVEVENREVARIKQVNVNSPYRNDFRQDIVMEWRDDGPPKGRSRPATVSAAEAYARAEANQKRFDRAAGAADKKDYAQAAALLRELLAEDPKDFQAWSELGTAYFLQGKPEEAEQAYLRALEARPTFALALVNLGRLRLAQKNYDGAVEALSKAVEAQPQSAAANLYLGEAYLQLKKGSKAVPHLNEAARLGRPEARLRLATLYNAAGMKDKAAQEYELFLSERPDHPDKKKLQQYIRENKKP